MEKGTTALIPEKVNLMSEFEENKAELTQNLEGILKSASYEKDQEGIFRSGRCGYWSNLNQDENRKFIALLKTITAREAVLSVYPQFERIIFSPKREAALELLQIKPGEVCIDYGCMWGALSLGMAKRGGRVIAIDQTYESLRFLAARVRDEGFDQVTLVEDDIKKVRLPGLADCAVVNGVLEWIPQTETVELKNFFGKRKSSQGPGVSPEKLQRNFLQNVASNLRKGGRLLLTIENRYDYTQFLGKRDPHANLLFTTIVPRPIANLISKVVLGRPYVNYLYSFPTLKQMLLECGFSKVELYTCFPDYRFPELILPYEKGLRRYQDYQVENSTWKRKILLRLERFLMKYLGARFFAPSIIAVATR